MLFATSVRGIFRNMILLTYSIAPVRDQVNSDANDSKRYTHPMCPGSEGVPFFFRRRILSHIVSMPSKSKIIVQRVDQHVEQL